MADKTKKIIELEFDVNTGKVNALNKELEKVEKGGKGAKKSVEGIGSAFNKVGLAIKAAGIGAVIALLATLKEILGENQAVVDFLSTAMNGLKIAFSDFFSFISDNIGTVTQYFKDLFDNPGEKLREIADTIKNYVIENVKLLISGFGKLGEAISYLFDGEFALALQSAKDGALEMGEALLKLNPATAVVANLAEAVYDNRDAIFDYTKGLVENAIAITDNKKALALLEIESRKMQLIHQQEAELQRRIRDDVGKSFEERIEANKRLGAILDESIQKEKELINTRIGLIQQEQELIGYTDERMLAIKNLEVELIDVEERVTGVKSEQMLNERALEMEQAAFLKELRDTEAAEIHAIIEELDRQRDIDVAKEEEAVKRKTALEQELRDKKIDLGRQGFDALMALNNAFAGQSEKAARRAFQINKALQIASAIGNTGVAVTAALTAGGNPIKLATGLQFAEAATAAALGLAQVATIGRTKFTPAGGGGSIPTISAPSSQSTANVPQFNTVGASATNQLSESIANQNNKPIQAYVVANDVTTAQSLQRNRQKQASFP